MATMKAMRIHEFGGSDALVYEDAPKPEPKAGEVLIKVAAAGINPIDWKVEEGMMEQQAPHVPAAHSRLGRGRNGGSAGARGSRRLLPGMLFSRWPTTGMTALTRSISPCLRILFALNLRR